MNALVKVQRHIIAAGFFFCLCSNCWGQQKVVYPTALISSSFFGVTYDAGYTKRFKPQKKISLAQLSVLEGTPYFFEEKVLTRPTAIEDTIPKSGSNTANSRALKEKPNSTKDGNKAVLTTDGAASMLEGNTNDNWRLLEDSSGTPKTKAATTRENSPLPTGCGTVIHLSAPTSPKTNDGTNTFDWTYSPGYTSPDLYEYTVDGGTLYQAVTAKPQPLGNKAYGVGQVGVRVKAGPNNYQSETVFNTAAFIVAPENLLPHSNFAFGFPFYLYNCTTNPTKSIPSPVSNPGVYYQNDLKGSMAEVRLFQYPLTAEETVTVSLYIKPANVDVLTLKVLSGYWGSIAEATFKLSTGAVSSIYNANGSVNAVAGYPGWYRVSLTYTSSTTTTDGKLQIFLPETTSTTNQKTFHLAGVQLNRGATSGTFVPR